MIRKNKKLFGTVALLSLLFFFSFAEAAGTPSIVSYQGRLADASGNLLGGSGTTYYFKFSIWDNSTVATGNRLWPTASPSSDALTVKSGVFNVNIGDTANGYPDTLDYDFNTASDVYLQVEVSSDNVTFQTLSPRQRISATPFAKLAGAVSGTGASSFGTTAPFGTSVVSVQATSTNASALSLRGALGQFANLFQIQDSTGLNLLSVNSTGGLFASSSLAVTGPANLYSTLAVSGAGTSTFSGGLDVTKGLQLNNGYVFGAGLTSCSGAGDKLVWHSDTGKFGCGVDAGGSGSGISALQAQYSPAQTGGTQTLATSSDTNIGLTIISNSDTHMFTPTWIGVLAAGRGGTGTSSPTAAGVLLGAYTGGGYQSLATSSLGIALSDTTGTLSTARGGTGAATLADLIALGTDTTGSYVSTLANAANGGLTVSGSGSETATVTVSLDLTHSNIWSGLQQFDGSASSTAFSALDYVAVGRTATTTIRGEANATSTFAGGIQASYLSLTGTSATSTFANGLNITGGCLSVNGVCVSQNSGTVTSITASSPGGTLSLGGTNPITNSGTISFDLNLGHANAFTALQQFSANASTTQLSSGLAYFGTTATSTFASNGALTLSTALLPSSGGTGTSSPSAAGILLGTYAGGAYQSLATSSLGILTTNVAEGTNLYYLDSRVQSFVNGSTTIPKTYTANTFSGLQAFSNTGTTTFAGGIDFTYLNQTGTTATSTFANGISLNTGCFSVKGTCVGTNSGTVTSVALSDANGSLSIGGTPITSNGTLTATLNLAHQNAFTALQQFSGNASTTQLSAGLAYFGTTATSSFSSTGVLTLASALTAGNGGTGTSSPSAAGILLGAYTGGGYQSLATSSLGINTDNLVEGSNNLFFTNNRFDSRLSATTSLPNIGTLAGLTLPATQLSDFGLPFYTFFHGTTTDALTQGTNNKYYADSLVNAFVNSSTTIPKTYSSNTFTNSQTLNGGLTIGALNGPLQANAGVVSATTSVGLVYGGTGATTASGARTNLGAAASGANSDITSLSGLTTALSVPQGGTGWASIQANSLLLGNGTSKLSTTSAGTDGFVLALSSGVPTWVATTTFSSGLAYSGGNVTNTGVLSIAGTPNQITASAPNGAVTLSLPSLLALTNASSTALSALDYISVGRTATTTIRGEANATSTFAGAIDASYLNLSGATATSTFAKGISLSGGCFSINGVCIGTSSGNGTVMSVQLATPNGTLSLGGTNPVTTTGIINVDLNLANANIWTGLQQFAHASSSLASSLDGIFVGRTATTTIRGEANATSTFAGGVDVATGLQLNSGYVFGAGLTACAASTDKLVWHADTGKFGCAVDAGSSGSGITSLLAQYSPAQGGATQTLATSSDTNIGLTIISNSDTHMFTPTWIGVLAAGRGGTGTSSPSAAGVLLGTYAGGGYQSLATSSLGLLTSNVAEGTNLYYTDTRVQSFVHASTTIPKTYTANTFTGLQAFSNTGTTTFAGGIDFTYLNQTGSTATSTFANGISLNTGCFSVKGTCVGATNGTVTSVALSDANGTLSIGGSPVTSNGTLTATLNLAHANAFSALQQFSGNASTTQLSAGLAYFGTTATSSFSSTGVLSLASALSAGSGGTGTSSPSAAGVLLGTYAGGGYQSLATSSLGLLTSNVAEGTNLYYTDTRVQSFVHASTTIPKTYTANTFTGLQAFSNTGTTTFAGGIDFTYLNQTGSTATSTFANGISLNSGCFSVKGTCVGATNGTVTSVALSDANGTLSIGGSPVTSNGTLTATLNLAHANAFSALQQFSGNASTTQLSAGLAYFGTTATSSFSSTGVLSLASALSAGSGGTGTSSPSAAGVLLGTYAGGGYQSLATSSLGLLTSNVAEGTNLYYTDTRVQSFVHASTTIPKTYTANTFTGLQAFSNTGTTTFAGGIDFTYLNQTGSTATSTFANGISLNSGCFSVKGTCVGATNGTVTSVALSDANGTLSIGGSPVTSNGTLTATLNLAHANAFSALQQFSGNASTTQLSAGLAYFGTTATSSFSSTGVLSLASALSAGSGGTGTSSPTAAGVLLGTYAGGGYQSLATSSLGLLTSNVAEGTNLYYTDTRVQSFVHASTTIPKTYTANTFTGLQAFSNTGTTTFAGGIDFTYLNQTGSTATSTFANGISLNSGCFSVKGTCVGATNGTVTSVALSDANGTLSIGGSPVTSNGTLTATLNLAHSNAFSALQQFSGNASTTQLSAGLAYFGTTATSSFSSTGVLSLASALSAGSGGTGTSSPTAAGVLLGTYAGGGYQSLATSSLGLLTSNVAEGTNLYYTDTRVQSFVHASTTIPKTYTANTFTGLQAFSNTGTTTFAGGIDFTYLNQTGSTATSTFANGISLNSGCFSVKGTCVGATNGTVTSVALSDANGTLSIGGSPVTSNGTLTATLNLAHANAFSALQQFSGNASTTQLSAGLAYFGTTATSSFSSTGVLSLASALSAGSGGTGTSSPTAAGVLLGTYAGGGYQSLATSSLGLLTSNVAEGTNLYYTDTRVQSFVHASTTIPKTYTANTFTGLQAFSNTGTTTFAGGIDFTYLNQTGSTATSTFANGISLNSGCFSVKGTCVGATNGTVTSVALSDANGTLSIGGSPVTSNGTLTATLNLAHSNAFSALQQFSGNASTTQLSAGLAYFGTTATSSFSSTGVLSLASALSAGSGGTGTSSPTAAGVLLGTYAGGGYQSLATSSLGLLTSNVAEGTNLYYTDTRVQSFVHASTTIPKTYTANTFTGLQAFSNTGTTTFAGGIDFTYLNQTGSTATSTFANGISLNSGCFSVKGTCVGATNGTVTSVALSDANGTLSIGGSPVTSNGTLTATLNLAHSNAFSALQQFSGNASTTQLSAGLAYFGTTATSSFSSTGVLSLASALSAGSGGTGTSSPTAAGVLLGTYAGGGYQSLATSSLGLLTSNVAEGTNLYYTDTRVQSFVHASTTIPKTYTANTFTGLQAFSNTGTTTFAGGIDFTYLNQTGSTATSTFANGISLNSGCFSVKGTCVGATNGTVTSVALSDANGTLSIGGSPVTSNGTLTATLNLAHANAFSALQQFSGNASTTQLSAGLAYFGTTATSSFSSTGVLSLASALSAGSGGTGTSSPSAAGVLLGTYAGGGYQSLATSSLGLLTSNVAEGTNLYYTDTRVQSFVHASTTIPKTYTANTFTGLQAFSNTGTTTFAGGIDFTYLNQTGSTATSTFANGISLNSGCFSVKGTCVGATNGTVTSVALSDANGTLSIGGSPVTSNGTLTATLNLAHANAFSALQQFSGNASTTQLSAGLAYFGTTATSSFSSTGVLSLASALSAGSGGTGTSSPSAAGVLLGTYAGGGYQSLATSSLGLLTSNVAEGTNLYYTDTRVQSFVHASTTIPKTYTANTFTGLQAFSNTGTTTFAGGIDFTYLNQTGSTATSTFANGISLNSGCFSVKGTCVGATNGTVTSVALSDANGTLSIGGSPVTSNGTLTATLNLAHANAFSALQQFSGNASTTQLSAGLAYFGTTATSSFSSTGVLSLASALSAGSGGTGTSSPSAAGVLLGTYAGGGYQSLATSSLGLLTSNVAEGTNLYYTDTRVQSFVHASTTIPKTYTANTFTGLQAFSNTGTTTFAGGIDFTYLNQTGSTATSTFANGISLNSGCFSVKGTCVGATNGTVTSVALSDANGTLSIGGSPVTSNGTLTATLNLAHSNAFSALQQFSGNASTTQLSAGLAYFGTTATSSFSSTGVLSLASALSAGSGGTGTSSPTAAGVLLGTYAGGGYQSLATSSLGLLTSNVAEGTNLYYTDTRVQSFVHASTTIPKTYTANTFTGLQAFSNTGTTTFAGGIDFTYLNQTGSTATSTFANGISLNSGCFSVKGTCVGATNGTVTSVALSDANGTLSIGGSPVTSNGTLTATLNLAHSNAFSALQQFSGNASTTQLSAGLAYFGTTATSSFSSTGVLSLASALSAGSGGTGTSSPSAAGVLLGTYAGGGYQSLATSSLGLLTSNVAEGTNLYYTDTRVQSFVHASTTIPKTYTANTFTGLQAFSNTGTTTFAGGIDFTYLNQTGSTATSTFANGISLNSGCFSVKGTCVGATNGTVTSVALSDANGTLSIGGSPVTSNGTLTATLNLAHANAFSALQQFSGNASTTQLSAGLAYFGTTATSSFSSTGVLSLASALSAGSGGTGTSSPSAAGVLLGTYAGGGYQSLATSSLGLLTSNVAEGTNLYYTDTRVQSFVHASTTIPKTYTANTFTGLQAFSNTGTTTFAGGIDFTYLNQTGSTATSTFANGISLNSGCFSVKGTCVGATNGTVTSVALSDANGTLSIGGSPVTSNGTLTATLNLAHANAFSALQQFSGNASTTQLSAGLAYFGTTATSSFSSTGVLSLASALSAGSGGTGTSSPTAAGVLLGTYAGGGYQSLATSSLGLLTSNVAEGTNLYYTDTRVQSFVHASTTIPKTYTANTFTGLQAFSNTGTTTFAGGIDFTYLNQTGSTATSTFANGISLNSGCFSVKGTCVGATNGTVTSVALSDANGTLSIGGSPVTSNGTLTATLNLAHANAFSALQQFSGNASTTQLSAGLAYFGTTATSSFSSTGVLSLASALSTGSGGTGTSSPSAAGVLLGTYAGGGYQSLATSSLGLLTSNVAEGTNLYYTDTRVQSFVHASTTIPKTYTANTFTGLQVFASASSTYFTVSLNGTATSSILSNSTSTIASGLSTPYLQLTGTSATSTFANGVSLSSGCFSINGTCIGTNLGTITGVTAGTGLTGGGTSGTVTLTNTNPFEWTPSALGFYQQLANATSTQIHFGATGVSLSASSTAIFAQASTTNIGSTGAAYFATGGGSVGIGTSTPNSALDVSAADTTNNASTTVLTIDHYSSGSAPAANEGGGLLFRNMNSASSTVNAASIVGLLSNVTAGSEAGQLAFYTRTGGGVLSEGMRIDNNGKVGIGSTTPAARLGIQTQAGDLVGFAVGSSTKSLLSVSTEGFGTTTLAGLNISATATSTSNVGMNLSSGCYAIGGTCIGAGGVGSVSIGSTIGGGATDGSVLFVQGGALTQDNANFFWNDTTNRLGLGTTTPFAKLSVNSIAGEPAFVIGSSTATSLIVDQYGKVGIASSSPYARFGIEAQAGDGWAFAVGSSTKSLLSVSTEGFGTTTLAGLNIVGLATSTSNVGFNITGGCYATRGVCPVPGAATVSIGSSVSGATDGSVLFVNSGVLAQNNAGLFFQNSTGNLGVGTTTPWGLLSVNANGLTPNAPQFVVGSSTATNFIVANGGNVGIGTTNPLATLQVNGQIVASGLVLTSSSTAFSTITSNGGSGKFISFSGAIANGGADSIFGNIRLDQYGNLKNIGTIQAGQTNLTNGGTFGTQTPYTVGSAPDSIAIGYVSGTSTPDIAVNNFGSQSISFLRSNGNGTLSSKTDYTTANANSTFVVLADMNGDGKLDMIVEESTKIGIFMNNGDGTFGSEVGYTTPNTSLDKIAIADLNGDGKPDVLVTRSGAVGTGTSLYVFLNKGNGTLGAATTYTAASGANGLAVGDLNGDGKADVIVTNYNANTASVFMNNGDGTLSSKTDYATVGTNPDSVKIADLNGDGKLDFVTKDGGNNTLSVFINNGNGTFAAAVNSYTTGTSAAFQIQDGLALADVNGDGYPDIIEVNNGDSTVSVLTNNGDGTFQSRVNYATGLGPLSVATPDLNGDGKPDLVVTNYNSQSGTTISVLLNQATTMFYARASTGNVGIGTSTPNSALDVSTDDTINNASSTVLTLDHYSTGSAPAANEGGGLLFRNMNSASSTVNAASIVGLLSNVTAGSEAGQLAFYTRTGGGVLSEGMRIDNAGNVGIGTTTPGSLLSIGNTQGINFTTATTTHNTTGGIDLRGGGCYAINGTCIGAGDAKEQNFSSAAGTTYTVPASSIMIIVEAWGGGGGGGGGGAGNSNTGRSGGGGGGGGAYQTKTFLPSDIGGAGANITVTTGTGGTKGNGATWALAGAAGSSGTAGANTTFGTSTQVYMIAYGGGGGGSTAATGSGGGGGGGAIGVGASVAASATGGIGGGGTAVSTNAAGGNGGGGGTSAAAGTSGGSAEYGGGGGAGSTTAGAAGSWNGGNSWKGGAGGGAGGTATASARAGGAGGQTATTTITNVAGTGGGSGSATAGATGAAGPAGYGGWGGAGGGSQTNGATAAAGGNGGLPGGGGGGGGGQGNATQGNGGAGGNGAAGLVRVTTIKGSGADLAEVYSTNDATLEAGDVVSLDPSLNAGVQKNTTSYDKNTLGVVSTDPGLTMGDVSDVTAVKSVPVALAGRVPVKVSTENGPIAAGDMLAPSSVPGVAMKAIKAGTVVGFALRPYDADGVGLIDMFIKVGQYDGVSAADLITPPMNPDGSQPPPPNPPDLGRAVLSYVMSTKDPLGQGDAVSQTITDRVVAGIEVVTPRVVTNTLVTSAIEPVDSAVSMNILSGGRFEIQKVGQYASTTVSVATSTSDIPPEMLVTVDDFGNAYFAGAISATGLELGSPTNPAGVIFYDTATGAPYCTKVTNGQLVTLPGKCGGNVPASLQSPPPPSDSSSTPPVVDSSQATSTLPDTQSGTGSSSGDSSGSNSTPPPDVSSEVTSPPPDSTTTPPPDSGGTTSDSSPPPDTSSP